MPKIISNLTHLKSNSCFYLSKTYSNHFNKWQIHSFRCRSQRPKCHASVSSCSHTPYPVCKIPLPLPWRCVRNPTTSYSTSVIPALVQATVNSPLQWPPCFHLCPLQSIHNKAARGILPKCTSAYDTLLLKSTNGSPFYLQGKSHNLSVLPSVSVSLSVSLSTPPRRLTPASITWVGFSCSWNMKSILLYWTLPEKQISAWLTPSFPSSPYSNVTWSGLAWWTI